MCALQSPCKPTLVFCPTRIMKIRGCSVLKFMLLVCMSHKHKFDVRFNDTTTGGCWRARAKPAWRPYVAARGCGRGEGSCLWAALQGTGIAGYHNALDPCIHKKYL